MLPRPSAILAAEFIGATTESGKLISSSLLILSNEPQARGSVARVSGRALPHASAVTIEPHPGHVVLQADHQLFIAMPLE
jgi:hypothetical protein